MSAKRYNVLSYDPRYAQWVEARRLSDVLDPNIDGLVVLADDYEGLGEELSKLERTTLRAVNRLLVHAFMAERVGNHQTASECRSIAKDLKEVVRCCPDKKDPHESV